MFVSLNLLKSESALCPAKMMRAFCQLWRDERGQDIAEYAVMLAVILIIVVGTVRLIGTNASSVFSNVGSSTQ
jgi:Flp pilus assembly pilin Flp